MIDRAEGKKLFDHYREHRDGIRNEPKMASVCLICGSIHLKPHDSEPGMLICCNCGFAFYRYSCSVCGKTVDARDPVNKCCPECGWRICSCGACNCSIIAPAIS